MGLIRVLFLALFTFLIMRLLGTLFGRGNAPARPREERPEAEERQGPGHAERLVACAQCQIRIPESQALPARSGGAEQLVCSEECREAMAVRK